MRKEIIESGNFWYLQKDYPELYHFLHEAECNVLINKKISALNIRMALECFLDTLVGEDIIPTEYYATDDFITTAKTIEYLRDNNLLIYPDTCFEYYDIKRGKARRGQAACYSFLREIGNMGGHSGKTGTSSIELTHENIYKSLALFYELTRKLIQKRLPYSTMKAFYASEAYTKNQFSNKNMPIGDYCIEEKKQDSHISNRINGAKVVYFGYTKDNWGRRYQNVIIKQYDLSSLAESQKRYCNRAFDAMVQMKREMQSNLLADQIQILGDDLYFSVYFIPGEQIISLKEILRKDKDTLQFFTLEAREKLCVELIDYVYKVRKSVELECVRNISDRIIYGYTDGPTISFKLIDYDLIRFRTNENSETVLAATSEYYKKIKDGINDDLVQYVAPELMDQTSLEHVNWLSADIYALGKLIRLIINPEKIDLSSSKYDWVAIETRASELECSKRCNIDELYQLTSNSQNREANKPKEHSGINNLRKKRFQD